MLKIYNTLTKKKEVFKPLKRGKINLFVCGPTVYDLAHLGHARLAIFFDVVAKYLKQSFKVNYLQNITDVDDKIIKRAKKEKISPKKIARRFEKEYLKTIKLLKINSVTKYPRATDHIKEIISQVKRLLKKGYAYKISDGIYYDISKFKDYGKLSKRTRLQAEDAVSRIDESKEKRNKGDFCLWKYPSKDVSRLLEKQKNNLKRKKSKKGTLIIINNEPIWTSPFGPGRPGWHIEDTAITEKYFGPQYDIHGGGMDLIFPHHEAEIAQMEAISGKKPLARYWMHCGLLTIGGKKMAKSFGNFITIENFLKKYNPRILRLLFLKSYYRSPFDYNEKLIEQLKRDLERIDEFIERLKEKENSYSSLKNKRQNKKEPSPFLKLAEGGFDIGRDVKTLISKIENEFKRAMDDDFNTPLALSLVFHLINRGNWLLDRGKISPQDAKNILKTLRKIDKVFSFIFKEKREEKIPTSVLSLTKKREKYRKEKKWKEADEIRKKINELGYLIQDTKRGPKLKKI